MEILELKNTITKIRSLINDFKSRMEETEKRINGFEEDKTIELPNVNIT